MNKCMMACKGVEKMENAQEGVACEASKDVGPPPPICNCSKVKKRPVCGLIGGLYDNKCLLKCAGDRPGGSFIDDNNKKICVVSGMGFMLTKD